MKIKYVGPIEHIPELYDAKTAKLLIEKGYTISTQEQKTRWYEESLWTVFVSFGSEVIEPQTDLNRECLNAVLGSLARMARYMS